MVIMIEVVVLARNRLTRDGERGGATILFWREEWSRGVLDVFCGEERGGGREVAECRERKGTGGCGEREKEK